MSKKVWIINQYGSLPSTGIGGRHRDLARELAKLGYDVIIVSSRWTHLVRDPDAAATAPANEGFEGFRFVRLPSRRYKHAHDKLRIVNWFVFAWHVARLRNRLKDKPDVILYSSPSLVGYIGARWLAWRSDAKLVFEVRDIWPLTFQEVGGYSSRHPFIRFLQWLEDYAYRTADHATSNLQGAGEHMLKRGLPADRFTWIANGFAVDEVRDAEPLPASVVESIPAEGFKICYAGTMGSANALEPLIEAARQLSERRSDIYFILVGQGRNKASLLERARALGLSNIVFLDAVPKRQVQSVINQCDACFIGWKDSSLYNYGIAANKLFDYLYAGKPILHSYSGKFDPIFRYGAGVTVPAENSSSIAMAALQLRNMSEADRKSMGEKGHQAAMAEHEYAVLARKYDSLFEQLTEDRGQ
jgi:glycosyltransferase involved in cell wall biosynthesis